MKSPVRKIVIDPVCEMDVYTNSSPGISFSGRRTYHFCSFTCKREFDRNPDYYVEKIARAAIEERNRYGEGKSRGRRAFRRRSTEKRLVSHVGR